MLDHPLFVEDIARYRREALLAEVAHAAQVRAAHATQAKHTHRPVWRRALQACRPLRRPTVLPPSHA